MDPTRLRSAWPAVFVTLALFVTAALPCSGQELGARPSVLAGVLQQAADSAQREEPQQDADAAREKKRAAEKQAQRRGEEARRAAQGRAAKGESDDDRSKARKKTDADRANDKRRAQERQAKEAAPRKKALPTAIPAVVPPGKRGPVLRIPGAKYHWGHVIQGAQVEHTFEVHNDGDMPLEIFGVKPGCGCTTASFDRIIEPGAVGHIQMIMDTSKLRREMRKRSTISCNVPNDSYPVVSLGGKVQPVLIWAPKTPKLTGPMKAAKELTFTVKKGSRFPLDVKQTKMRLGRCELVSFEPVTEGAEYRVTVRAKGAVIPETTSDALIVTSIVNGEEREDMVPVVIEHLPSILIGPRKNVMFAQHVTDKLRDKNPEVVDYTFTLDALDPAHEFQVTRIETLNTPEGLFVPELKVVEAGKKYAVTVTLTRFENVRTIRGSLIVHTDDAETPKITVPLYAQYKVRKPPRPRGTPARPAAKPKPRPTETKQRPTTQPAGQPEQQPAAAPSKNEG